MMLFGSWWNIDKAAGSDRRLSRLLLDEPGDPLGEDQTDHQQELAEFSEEADASLGFSTCGLAAADFQF
ncbi:hypothetical protein ABIF63_002748 [Bradyrhizobium japonicum]|uniref:Uncharacterized protein n=1 Tax=Bradyrhizobium japonicum TaxID=375 RepID=A0ABV2RP76_BRAJP|nr:hypothetical protein [Bradyrhizobium japonicum]UQD97879.1 hypothetical protein JEY30_41625 [Bradyrhizobium japonicum]WLB17808.1 hypothetical protein QIH95_38500 [Bradyrhizobium japonicum]